METVAQKEVKTRDIVVDPDWCPGCGDFGVLKGLKKGSIDHELQEIEPHNLFVASGIGCSSNLPGFINAYGVHGLHGRSLPLATGVKIANEKMNVVITGGDGDGYGIGVGHFIHSMRRNLDLTYVVMNNQIYGLTTGQASATSPLGLKTKSTPQGNQEKELNPLALALVSGATFVARAYSGQVKQLSSIISQAIKHRGFSIIDVYSPCVTYYNTYEVFKKIIYKIDDEKPDRDLTDFNAAMNIVSTSEERIPVGIFYQVNQSIYEESDPVLKRGPLVDQSIGLSKDTFEKLLAETM